MTQIRPDVKYEVDFTSGLLFIGNYDYKVKIIRSCALPSQATCADDPEEPVIFHSLWIQAADPHLLYPYVFHCKYKVLKLPIRILHCNPYKFGGFTP